MLIIDTKHEQHENRCIEIVHITRIRQIKPKVKRRNRLRKDKKLGEKETVTKQLIVKLETLSKQVNKIHKQGTRHTNTTTKT